MEVFVENAERSYFHNDLGIFKVIFKPCYLFLEGETYQACHNDFST